MTLGSALEPAALAEMNHEALKVGLSDRAESGVRIAADVNAFHALSYHSRVETVTLWTWLRSRRNC